MDSIQNLKEQAHELVDSGKYEEAIPVFNEILKIEPTDHEVWYFLAMTYIELEKHHDAEKAMVKAVELEPENTEYLLQLGYLKHMDGKIEESSKLFNQILDIDPLDAEAQLMLGLIAKDEERFQDAIDLLESSFNTDQDVDTLIHIIECHLDLGELDIAEKKLEQLSNSELEGHQFEEERELLARFYLDKAMSSWTGTSTGDDGETLYFPETLEQVHDAEHFLECAEIRKPKDEYYIDRIQQLKDVVAANKEDLLNEENQVESQQSSDFSDEDNKAWELMDEIYDLWTYSEEDDGIEYHWPNTVLEVKESKKLISQAKKIKYKSDEVKNRIKAIEDVLDLTKSWTPKNTSKVIFALIFSLIAIVGIFLGSKFSTFKRPDFKYSQNDWILSERTDLTHNSFISSYGGEIEHHISLNAGTQLIPIARMGTYWAQVETQSGQRGFVFFWNLNGAKKPMVNRNTVIYSDLTKQTVVDSVFENENVSLISHEKDGKEAIPYLAKVRNARGKTGYIWDYALDYPFFENLPEISQTTTFPTSVQNLDNKIVGKKIADAEKKFGPATSIINSSGKNIAYFRQINVVKNKQKFRGINFNLDNSQNVTSYELVNETKYKFLEKLPLVKQMRDYELFRILGFSFYQSKDKEIGWWEKFKHINWITKIIGFLVGLIIVLGGAFLFFSLPRLIVNPLVVIISYAKIFGNGMVYLLNFLIYAAMTYVFFAAMALLMNQMFTPLIFAVPSFIFWWVRLNSDIDYNRCPDCHTMNVGVDKGSTFKGRSQEVSYGSYDVYKGKTETSTQIIHNYERHKTKTTTTIRHYLDHRQCIYCGHEWDVARQVTESENTVDI